MYDFKIDYVFPYVDNSDPEWVKEYNKYSDNSIGTEKCRFRDFGTLKCIFRGIFENMTWINNLYFLVATESQVPDWLNTKKVKVITHKDFIPSKYLPTFNSSTIELFLHKIPGLEEHFIYGNDDTFIYKPLQPEDFFDENGNPIVEYKSFDNLESSFHKLVKRSYDNAKELYDKEHGWRTDLDEYRKAPGAPINMEFLKQAHYQIGLRKSTAERLVNFLDKYGRTDLYATRFRDLDKNVNQYMYTDYQILSRQYTRRRRENTLGEYLSCNGHSLEELEKLITSHELPILCFNDSGTKEEYVPFIKAFFERVFPKKSGYEK